jgi:hypothetical protein
MRFIAPVAGLVVAATLVACQPTAPQTAVPPPGRGPETAAPSAPATEPEAAPPFTPATNAGLALRPVDPLSLEDRPGAEALTVGPIGAWDVAVSPNGRTLAAVVESPGDQARGALILVDLDRWAVDLAGVELHSTGLQPDPDSAALWWLDQHTTVRRWAPGAGTTTDVPLPDGFWSPSVTPLGGGRAAVYGQKLAGSWSESVGPPTVVLVDGDSITADIPLHDVAESRTRIDEGLHVMAAGLAWDVERARLYVVDPASSDVTVVDLDRGRVVAGSPTVLQRLASWLVPSAHAKMLEGVQLSATLSPAGDRLYVTGTRDGGPLGIRVIDTATLEEVARSSLAVESITLSPDDAVLFAPALTGDPGWLVIDRETLDVVDRLPVEGWLAGFTPDSRHAYITTYRQQREWTQVLDLTSRQIIAQREGRYLPDAGVLATWSLP